MTVMLKRRRLLLIALSLSTKLFAQGGGSPAKKTFTVVGKVQHPGQFDLRDGMRVTEAFPLAGGFVDFAFTALTADQGVIAVVNWKA